MRSIFIIISLIFITSCDDGNFEAPTFNFEDSSVQNCGNLILYKTNESEALLLELNEDNTNDIFFKTEQDHKEYSLTDKIFYRTYNTAVPTDFFCSAIPPSTPKLNKEWLGSGKLIVDNTITENDDGSFTYVAVFTIENMVLINSSGNSIVYDTYNFGGKTGTFN